MSLYEGLRTNVRGGSGFLEEFGVSVGVRQGSVLSPLIFAIVIDIVTKDARKSPYLLNDSLYADEQKCGGFKGKIPKVEKYIGRQRIKSKYW